MIGNLLLAGILYVDRGEIPGIYSGGATIQAGASASVNTERSRLRSQPGQDSGIVGLLSIDQIVEVTGSSESVNGNLWWPVTAEIDGVSVDGYVSAQLLDPVDGPGDIWLKRATDEVRSWPGRLLERVGIGEIDVT
jgi:hypothetical protein